MSKFFWLLIDLCWISQREGFLFYLYSWLSNQTSKITEKQKQQYNIKCLGACAQKGTSWVRVDGHTLTILNIARSHLGLACAMSLSNFSGTSRYTNANLLMNVWDISNKRADKFKTYFHIVTWKQMCSRRWFHCWTADLLESHPQFWRTWDIYFLEKVSITLDCKNGSKDRSSGLSKGFHLWNRCTSGLFLTEP